MCVCVCVCVCVCESQYEALCVCESVLGCVCALQATLLSPGSITLLSGPLPSTRASPLGGGGRGRSCTRAPQANTPDVLPRNATSHMSIPLSGILMLSAVLPHKPWSSVTNCPLFPPQPRRSNRHFRCWMLFLSVSAGRSACAA